ncbi:hypothetical protein ACQPZG_20390 [Streptomyces sp. CA-294286]|uniref:hypothetical protein n=1 Tax=Streptomyces sp. CA-294286 TaxID=3240070 RepID=UPI003D906DE9
MSMGGEFVKATAGQQPTRSRTKRIDVAITVVAVIAAGVALAVWDPFTGRDSFTAYAVGLQDGTHTKPGSTPGSCVRTAASEEETVIYDEDGKKLAAGRAEKEGKVLGPEFNDYAGFCMVVTRIDAVPGDLGTYLSEWGRGDRLKLEESDLRRSVEDQLNGFKQEKPPKS